jgi:gliding motility-associated peptidyl-prolyl isomerase
MNRLLLASLLVAFVLGSCKSPEARRPVTVSSGSFIKESIERNQERIEQETTLIEHILAADSTKTFTATQSGFWYSYAKKDSLNNGIKPKFGDKVVFDYQISDLYGNVIYSKSQLSPRHYIIDKEELISGLRDALKMMHVGDSLNLILPSFKAYGYYGDQDKIGVNIPLQIAITLKNLEPTIIN